eukprot:g4251.t1
MAANVFAVLCLVLAAVGGATQAEVGPSGDAAPARGGRPRRSGFRVQMKKRRASAAAAAEAKSSGGDGAARAECQVILPGAHAGDVDCTAAHYAPAARRRRPLPLRYPVLGEVFALEPADGCARARELRVPGANGVRGARAAAAALSSASEAGALPLIALVERGGCSFAQKVRRVQALNRLVWRDAELQKRERAARAEGCNPDLVPACVDANLPDYPEDPETLRFAGLLIVDRNSSGGAAGRRALPAPPGLGAEPALWLPTVMVSHANGTALRRLALSGEHDGELQEPLTLSLQFS